MTPTTKKKTKKRILRTIKLMEISGVDRPAMQGADVAILKRYVPDPAERRQQILDRCDYSLADFMLLNKFNPNHYERGRFAERPGGSSSSSSSSADGAPAAPVTREHKDATLRWTQTVLRTAKIASWALVIPPMIAAFTATAPIAGAGFAIGAALATLVSRASLTKAAAFIALDTGLTKLIEHRESQLAKAASTDDPILRTLLAMQAELRRQKKETTVDKRDTDYTATDEFQALVDAECGASAMPRAIGAQRVIAKYGSRPDASGLLKLRKASDDFEEVVTDIRARDRCSRTEAMQKARREQPAAFEAFQEA